MMIYGLLGLVAAFGIASVWCLLGWQRTRVMLNQSEIMHANSEEIRQSAEQKALELESILESFNKESARINLENAALSARLESAKELLADKQKMIDEIAAQNKLDKEALESKNNEALEKLEKQYAKNLENLKIELDKQLEAQKSAMLDQNKLMLNRDSKAVLEEIFTPIKTRVEEYSKQLLQNEASLKQNIDNVFKYSQEMSKSAQALGQILRGDKKVRGNFGELQLKSVLESSGLIEGEQYKLQAHFKEEGKSYAPDAIVRLDENRSIIIDAKFPLPSELELGNDETNTLEISTLIAPQIAKNLKNRIDELAKKPYARFDENTYDFVLLFLPYNNLLDLALQGDSALYQYAYDRQVYLTTPQTLFMALKTISITWVHIQSDAKIHKAFEEIGKFYDKFVGVCEDFDRLNRALDSALRASNDMENKMRSGKGSLESRFDTLKALGAKTNKSIPKAQKNAIANNGLLSIENDESAEDVENT